MLSPDCKSRSRRPRKPLYSRRKSLVSAGRSISHPALRGSHPLFLRIFPPFQSRERNRPASRCHRRPAPARTSPSSSVPALYRLWLFSRWHSVRQAMTWWSGNRRVTSADSPPGNPCAGIYPLFVSWQPSPRRQRPPSCTRLYSCCSLLSL